MGDATSDRSDPPHVLPGDVQHARAMLGRTVEAIAAVRDRRDWRRPRRSNSHTRGVWSDHLLGEHAALCNALRQNTEMVARLERAHGRPPERLLIELKNLLRNVPGLQAEARMAMERDIVQWAIAAYFSDRTNEPRS